YAPNWPGHPLAALTCLAISPGAGLLWYCVPLLMCGRGLWVWRCQEYNLCRAVIAASIVFVGFVATLGTYKGDPSWGPRYLTPVASVLWLFAPMGAALLKPRLVALVLGLGFAVQLLALSVDPHRLFINRGVPSAFSSADPWAYFYPA